MTSRDIKISVIGSLILAIVAFGWVGYVNHVSGNKQLNTRLQRDIRN